MYKVILPFRYLFKKRISYVAFLAVALCVFIVVVVMTVMRGLVTDFKQKNHNFAGDCVVASDSLAGFAYYEEFMETLRQQEFIEAVSPVINSFALISNRGSDRNLGVEITGVDPVLHSKATGFGKTLHRKKDNIAGAFELTRDSNNIGCILGIDLALERNSDGAYDYENAPMGLVLSVTSFPLTARGALAKAVVGMINTKTFYYSDVSHSGLARVDSSMVYLPFEQAQLLCMAGAEKRVSRIHIKFKSETPLSTGCDKVAALWQDFTESKSDQSLNYLFDNVTVRSWKEHRREFIAAMEKEHTMLTVIFCLVGLTTVFIVFVIFYMIISHKTKDIGILMSVGVSKCSVVGIYLGFAFMLGLFGSAAGLTAGWLFLLRINQVEDWLFKAFSFQLWDRTIYAIGDIPNQTDPTTLTVIVASAILACLLGAFIPGYNAARLKPVETLQVNQL
jgi:lipoprotein-releasing system permease protein